jgi:hypothetical protein
LVDRWGAESREFSASEGPAPPSRTTRVAGQLPPLDKGPIERRALYVKVRVTRFGKASLPSDGGTSLFDPLVSLHCGIGRLRLPREEGV